VKITDVKLTVVNRVNDVRPEEYAIKNKGDTLIDLFNKFTVIQIVTDQGVTGECFSLGGDRGFAHYVADHIRPFLIGKNPLHREAIWQGMWHYNRFWFTPLFALGIVDVAIWDLYGKLIGQPVYEILGGYRDKLPSYASGMTKASISEFVEDALKYKEIGFQGYKIHSVGDPFVDIDTCTAIRKAVGDRYPLMIDAVSAYDQIQAMRVGRAVEELDFVWYEEPLREYDIHGYKMLAEALDIPIAAVEVNEGSLYTTPEYITTRAVDIVRSDCAFKGGVGQVKKTAALAEAFGLNLEIHTNGNSMLEAANIAVAASIKNTMFYERLVPDHLFIFGVNNPIEIDKEGFAHVPKGPGLGTTVDWGFVKRYKVAEI
jgi:L-alanine-DL-glutamate epimerase-like enolase superfamily enzyme